MKAMYEYLMIVLGVLVVFSLGAGIFFSMMVTMDSSLHGNPFAVLGRPDHYFFSECLLSLLVAVGLIVGLVIVFRRRRGMQG